MRIRTGLIGVAALPVLLVALVLVLAFARDRDRSEPAHLQYKADYLAALEHRQGSGPRPNILVILYDDLGYGDFGAYGNRAYRTPAIDRLAQAGARFTNYYAPAPVCTPSRAGLLTGRYPLRSGFTLVHHPRNSALDWMMRAGGAVTRLPKDEILLPEILRASGYRTAMVGKWHLGDVAGSLPNDFGFESFYGAHYSNDMKPFALYDNERVAVPAPADQTRLNELYTAAVVRTIEADSERPFFIYFAHNMPHEPLHAGADFRGRSGSGLYGDVLEELDDGVRRIIEALRRSGKLDDTLILLTSDNGPWFEGDSRSRGRKGTTFEGGMRVPMIAFWPGRIEPAVIAQPAVGVDILPTILDYLSIAAPSDRLLDGASLRAMLENPGGAAPHVVNYFRGAGLLALRHGNLKYQTRKFVNYEVDSALAIPAAKGPWLFNLDKDPRESYNLLYGAEPATGMAKRFAEAKARFAANPRGWAKPARAETE